MPDTHFKSSFISDDTLYVPDTRKFYFLTSNRFSRYSPRIHISNIHSTYSKSFELWPYWTVIIRWISLVFTGAVTLNVLQCYHYSEYNKNQTHGNEVRFILLYPP